MVLKNNVNEYDAQNYKVANEIQIYIFYQLYWYHFYHIINLILITQISSFFIFAFINLNNIHFLYVVLYILKYVVVLMLYWYHEMQNIINFTEL
jgi:hypothetical protein